MKQEQDRCRRQQQYVLKKAFSFFLLTLRLKVPFIKKASYYFFPVRHYVV